MTIQSFRELRVWQAAMDFAEQIFAATKLLPREDQYGLVSQLRRAAVSVPSNIAEGNRRGTTRDYLKFLSIANGSLAEIETQLILCQRYNYLTELQVTALIADATEISRLLNALSKALRTNLKQGRGRETSRTPNP